MFIVRDLMFTKTSVFAQNKDFGCISQCSQHLSLFYHWQRGSRNCFPFPTPAVPMTYLLHEYSYAFSVVTNQTEGKINEHKIRMQSFRRDRHDTPTRGEVLILIFCDCKRLCLFSYKQYSGDIVVQLY